MTKPSESLEVECFGAEIVNQELLPLIFYLVQITENFALKIEIMKDVNCLLVRNKRNPPFFSECDGWQVIQFNTIVVQDKYIFHSAL